MPESQPDAPNAAQALLAALGDEAEDDEGANMDAERSAVAAHAQPRQVGRR
jgi:hypothetical protein